MLASSVMMIVIELNETISLGTSNSDGENNT